MKLPTTRNCTIPDSDIIGELVPGRAQSKADQIGSRPEQRRLLAENNLGMEKTIRAEMMQVDEMHTTLKSLIENFGNRTVIALEKRDHAKEP
jgi:hypothetical protein